MKTIYIIILATCVSLISYSQTDKGIFVLSAGSSLTNVSTTIDDVDPGTLNGVESSSNNLDFEIGGGFFVSDGLMLGLSLIYDSDISKTEVNNYELTGTTTNITFAPTLRYYFGESGAFGGIAYALGTINYLEEETGYEDVEDTRSVSGLIISGGYSFFINDIIAFTPSLSYSMLNVLEVDGYYDPALLSNVDLTTSTSSLTFGFGINIHLDN
mgnify:FL=1